MTNKEFIEGLTEDQRLSLYCDIFLDNIKSVGCDRCFAKEYCDTEFPEDDDAEGSCIVVMKKWLDSEVDKESNFYKDVTFAIREK